jgi:protein arginine kinase activator
MYCEKCKNREATVHLTEIIKEVKSEAHLCEFCAREIGLNSKLSDFKISLPEMLSFLDISEIDETVSSDRCCVCGTEFADYSKTGVLGCASCYQSFREHIIPVLKRYHGSADHIGRIPSSYKSQPQAAAPLVDSSFIVDRSSDYSISDLQRMLDEAVSDERYEEAADIRDRIRLIKIDI